ncbi:hypothetical protein [Tsukamurella strandjordii]|uniref:Uncharacterized protein n=1 Tax=Tsukamurella strandjordii TaxID=147577 RepID=A0AA90S8I4_9ACTN|nr:hypothetical protein [Tsukamurella strandjordii]MDP0398930.1 hypothetical protein [Tsukamurella strandjordii]
MPGRPNRGRDRENWTPRPPFEPGNAAAVTHGAHSSALIAARVAELTAEIEAAVPTLAAVRYTSAVRAWATAEARLERVREYVWNQPVEELSGERGTGAYELGLERLAVRLRAELALSIASHAAISRTSLAVESNSEAARSMVTKLFDDIRRVVDSGQLDAAEHATVPRGQLTEIRGETP